MKTNVGSPSDRKIYVKQALELLKDGQWNDIDEVREMLVLLFVMGWPAPVVSRSQIETFSGGLITSGTLANLDCKGEGIKPKLSSVSGRRVCYPTLHAARFIVSRLVCI